MIFLRALPVGLMVLAFVATGCETVVKRNPIPVSEVKFLTASHQWIFTAEPIKSVGSVLASNRKLHCDYYGRPDCVLIPRMPVSQLIEHAQYVGRISWSGTIPEIRIPESQFESDRLPVPVMIPERVQAKIKEDAAQLGGNIVILDLNDVGDHWVVENGKLQPDFLFFSKAYYLTNAP